MSQEARPVVTPHRATPLIHVLFAATAVFILYLPLVNLPDGTALNVMEIAGGWALISLGGLCITGLAGLLLIAADRVSWSRVLIVDMLIIVSLIPAVVGLVVQWQSPQAGIDGFGTGFWLAVALLVARFPVSIWIRGHAARTQAALRSQGE